MTLTEKPLIHRYFKHPLTPEEIEAHSLSIIDQEAPAHGFSPLQWQVVRRMIHTSGDFGLVKDVLFSQEAIEAALAALKDGQLLYVDSNMIRAGLSLARLVRVNERYTKERIICHVADEDVAQKAQASGLPRSIWAVRKAKPRVDGAIVAIGNAPLALLELNRMIVEEKVRPAIVIGMPVGFVHVNESKEELTTLDVPYIVLNGRRGGSPLAVCVIHALCALA